MILPNSGSTLVTNQCHNLCQKKKLVPVSCTILHIQDSLDLRNLMLTPYPNIIELVFYCILTSEWETWWPHGIFFDASP